METNLQSGSDEVWNSKYYKYNFKDKIHL
jgi:hypothetical protein